MKPDLKIRMVRIRGDVNVVQEGGKKQKWTGYQQTGAWLLIPQGNWRPTKPWAQMRGETGVNSTVKEEPLQMSTLKSKHNTPASLSLLGV